MARPRKGTEEVWYDTFAEWSEEDRTAALKVVTILHRQLVREARRAMTFGGQAAAQEPQQHENGAAEGGWLGAGEDAHL